MNTNITFHVHATSKTAINRRYNFMGSIFVSPEAAIEHALILQGMSQSEAHKLAYSSTIVIHPF